MEPNFKDIRRVFDSEAKSGFRLLSALTVLYLIYLFVLSFLAQITFVSQALSALKLADHLFYIPITVIIYVLSTLIFSNDVLYYSSPKQDKYVHAFQRNLPTKLLCEKLNIDSRQAEFLWFGEFNKWARTDHLRHAEYLKTYQRGFACRFVYVLIRSSWIFFMIASALLITESALVLRGIEFTNVDTFGSRWLFVALMLVLNLYLRASNRTGRVTTGVWKRFDEINDNNREWISVNIERFRGGESTPSI
jgi:hypothetical protein